MLETRRLGQTSLVLHWGLSSRTERVKPNSRLGHIIPTLCLGVGSGVPSSARYATNTPLKFMLINAFEIPRGALLEALLHFMYNIA